MPARLHGSGTRSKLVCMLAPESAHTEHDTDRQPGFLIQSGISLFTSQLAQVEPDTAHEILTVPLEMACAAAI